MFAAERPMTNPQTTPDKRSKKTGIEMPQQPIKRKRKKTKNEITEKQKLKKFVDDQQKQHNNNNAPIILAENQAPKYG
jgi:hypothetical protein